MKLSIFLSIVFMCLALPQCKERTETHPQSKLRSDWSPDGEWEDAGDGKKRRKWVIEWQCAVTGGPGGKLQDEYCEWDRNVVDTTGNLSCEFRTNFLENRKYFLTQRMKTASIWAHTNPNSFQALENLVRECSVQNAHCDKEKIDALIATTPECQNSDQMEQHDCLKQSIFKCGADCNEVMRYADLDCLNNPSEECTGLDMTNGKRNRIKPCKIRNKTVPKIQKCIDDIATQCKQPCLATCDEFRASDPQVCQDMQRIKFDEGSQLDIVAHDIIVDVIDSELTREPRWLIQLQATSPESLPSGCAYDLDPSLKAKLKQAGWTDTQMTDYALEEKTFVKCDLSKEQTATQGVQSCDDLAGSFRAGVSTWITRSND
jgi:hypothetical protein